MGGHGKHVSMLDFHFKVQKFYQAVLRCESLTSFRKGLVSPFSLISLSSSWAVFSNYLWSPYLFLFFWNFCLHTIFFFFLHLIFSGH